MMFKKMLFLVLIAGCGSPTTQDSSTDLKYRNMGSLSRMLLAKAREPVINVCLRGNVSSTDLARAKAWSKKGILTWFRAVKVIDKKVTHHIAFTCTNKHITFNLKQGSGTSNAGASRVNIYMRKPFGTWTHELGHALAGLADTYNGRSAGSCNDRVSLMCWGAFGPRANPNTHSTLWPDDIAGIQTNYRKLFSDLEAPEWGGMIDLEGPIDADKPWPEDGDEFELPDSDGDGIVDYLDQCSKTPEGEKVWKTGEYTGCSGGQHIDKN